MAVLNTTSPAEAPEAPIAWPCNSVPSASARIAGTGAMDTARFLSWRRQMCEAGKALQPAPLRRLRIIPRPPAPLNEAAASVRRAEAAVHGEQVPGHVIGGRRGQEYRRAGDLRRLAPAARRRAPRHPGGELGILDQRR